MTQHIKDLATRQDIAIQNRLSNIENIRMLLVEQQTHARASLNENQEQRLFAENSARQKRFNSGWRGLFDRITGKTGRICMQIEHEIVESKQRNEKEKDALIFQHLNQRQTLQARVDRLTSFSRKHKESVDRDLRQYRKIEKGRKESFTGQHAVPDCEQ